MPSAKRRLKELPVDANFDQWPDPSGQVQYLVSGRGLEAVFYDLGRGAADDRNGVTHQDAIIVLTSCHIAWF